MEHLDPDELVLLALSERQGRQADDSAVRDAPSAGHLQTCDLCRAELTQLAHTVELARSAGERGPAGPLVLPASIWSGIAAELGIGSESGEFDRDYRSSSALTSVPAPRGPDTIGRPAWSDDEPIDQGGNEPPDRSRHLRTGDLRTGDLPTGDLPTGDLRTGERRSAVGGGRRRPAVGGRTVSWRRGLLAAALVVAAGAGTAAGVAIGHRSDVSPAAVEYQADLVPMKAAPIDARATATVTKTEAAQTLEVNARQLPLRQGYYEVWLYNPTADKMVAVGTLGAAGDGVFTLASTIDLRSYSVVDVSAQDFDGNPAHKTSMLQGPLSQ